jgi:hypothetical protein
MRLFSPEEDFHRYTLDRIKGVLARACYFANLKEQDGTLYHWGLQRQYGLRKTAEVLNVTFREQLQTLLQERLAVLWEETQVISQKMSLDSNTFLDKLKNDLDELASERLTSLQQRQLRSTLGALSEIAASQRSTQDSSQTQQFAR